MSATRKANADALYFQSHGLRTSAPSQLAQGLVLAIEQLKRSLYRESSEELSEAELSALVAGGFDVKERAHKEADPLAKTTELYAALITTSWSTSDVATKLSVQPSRIRQMLTDRSLYGFHVDNRWLIPFFQFDEKNLIPNIIKINAVLNSTLSPVLVYNWYITPDPELSLQGRILSPLEWLRTGQFLDKLTRIASSL